MRELIERIEQLEEGFKLRGRKKVVPKAKDRAKGEMGTGVKRITRGCPKGTKMIFGKCRERHESVGLDDGESIEKLIERIEQLTERKKRSAAQRRKAKAARKKRRINRNPSVLQGEAMAHLNKMVEGSDVYKLGPDSGRDDVDMEFQEVEGDLEEIIVYFAGSASDEFMIDDADLEDPQEASTVDYSAALTIAPSSDGKDIEFIMEYSVDVQQGDGTVDDVRTPDSGQVDLPSKEVLKLKSIGQLRSKISGAIGSAPYPPSFTDWDDWANENDPGRARDWADHLRYD